MTSASGSARKRPPHEPVRIIEHRNAGYKHRPGGWPPRGRAVRGARDTSWREDCRPYRTTVSTVGPDGGLHGRTRRCGGRRCAFLLLVTARPARADAPGENEESAQLVRQAIALIVNTPGDMAGIEDKIADARNAARQLGVDLDLLAQAQGAFTIGDMHQVRVLLERSIGAQPHRGNTDPLPIGQTRGQPGMAMATGAETGTDVVADGVPADRYVSGGDLIVVAALVAVAVLGVWLAVRFRPTRLYEARA